MKRLTKAAMVLGFGLALLVPGRVEAVDPQTSEEAVSAMESFYANVQSMEADFVQITRSPTMGTEEEQRGRISLKRLGRWLGLYSTRPPFVSHRRSADVDPFARRQQVIHYRDVGECPRAADSLLSEMDKIDESFNVALVPSWRAGLRPLLNELDSERGSAFQKPFVGGSQGQADTQANSGGG